MSNLSEKLCRICLKSNEKLYSLSSSNVTIQNASALKAENVCLGEIYEQFTQLKYDNQSEWMWICTYCHDKLVDFHQFRILCIESSHKLIEISLSQPIEDGVDVLKDDFNISDNDQAFDDQLDGENDDNEIKSEEIVEAIVSIFLADFDAYFRKIC